MKLTGAIKGVLWVLAIATAAFAWAAPVRADIIRWNLVDFKFLDGGTATGFFDWDTVAATSPNYEISVSGGNTANFPAFTYTDETTKFATTQGAQNILFFFDDSIVPLRVIRIGVPSLSDLNTPVSVLDLAPYAPTGPAGFIECFNCTPARNGDAAAEAHLAVPTPAPEPATGWLLAGGLMLVFGLRGRRAAGSGLCACGS